MTILTGTIQLRHDTAANWTNANPTLLEGEAGYETDTGKIKFGDGSTAWTSLSYRFTSASAAWGGITGTLSDQTDLNSALAAKEASITAGTTAQYWRGDKSFQTLNGAAVANTPAGNIAATTVQAAINELDTEKVATGDSRLTDARNLKLLGSSVTRYAAATTATDDVAHSLLIPAGTLTTGDFFRIYSLLSTTSSANNKTFKLWLHTAGVTPGDPVPGGAAQIAQNTITTSGQTSLLARLFAVRNNTTIIGHGNATTQATGEYSQATTAPTEITIPTLASDVYLLVSANRANAGDTAAVEYSRVHKED